MIPNNEIPLAPPTQANDGSEGNTFRLTEADMQRVIGFAQWVESLSRSDMTMPLLDEDNESKILEHIKWLDGIQPEHTIDPDGDLSEVDL